MKTYLDTIGLELNYGTDNKCNAILVKYRKKFITIPDLEELLSLVSEEDIEKIWEIRVYDIVLCWFVKSNFKDIVDNS